MHALTHFLSLSTVAGEKSSRDEQVACAMLATQLDNFLGGDPIQHRQVQGYESPEFMILFPRGVSYKVGGRRRDLTQTHPSVLESHWLIMKGISPINVACFSPKPNTIHSKQYFRLNP